MGSLTIVGLGPARPEHMTAEAQGLIKEATHLRWYALAHARGMAEQINPNIKIASLDYLYNTPTVERPVAYRDLAKMMVRKAYVDDIDVGYIVAGSPLFYNDAVLFIRRLCAEQGLEFLIGPRYVFCGFGFGSSRLDRLAWPTAVFCVEHCKRWSPTVDCCTGFALPVGRVHGCIRCS